MKKRLALFLCVCTVACTLSAPTVQAAEATQDEVVTVDSEAEEIAEELGGEAITLDELPAGVVPMRFDTVEEAQEFVSEVRTELAESELTTSDEFSDIRNIDSLVGSYNIMASNQGVKSYTHPVTIAGIHTNNLTIYASYTAAKGKYTGVNSVSSCLTGINACYIWGQDNYSYSIPTTGKKLYVTVFGHFDIYVYSGAKLIKIGTDSAKYGAAWDL